MKKLLTAILLLVTTITLSAQTFQARIQKGQAINQVDVYLRLNDTTVFTKTNHRFIGSAQFPIALPKNTVLPTGGIAVTMDSTFENVMSDGKYNVTVNPVDITDATANAGEQYYSVNLVIGSTVNQNIIPKNKEFRIFTVTFLGDNIPDRTKVKLLNVNYRLHKGNYQCQLAIEDNFGVEYTNPFTNPSKLFYIKQGKSKNGHAGTGFSTLGGWTPCTYNSWSSPL